MIELELPCCGGTTRVPELTHELECDGCGIVVALAPDPSVGDPAASAFAAAVALAA